MDESHASLQATYEKYGLTEYGFLPRDPVRRLTVSIGGQSVRTMNIGLWENVMDNLPELNKTGRIRQVIGDLPMFDAEILKSGTPEQLMRSYTILTLLTNSYVWQGTSDTNPPKDSICPKLAMPLCAISEKLGITPILTHAAVDLYNWEYIEPAKGFDLDNLKSTSLVTGEDSESWFYLIMVAIERVGGNIIKNLLLAMQHIENKGNKALGECLVNIRDDMKQCCDIISRMRERCKPEIFWNVLRPYLAGWKNNDALPNGMKYEGVDQEYRQFFGGSAAQSSLFAVVDGAFGIEHKSEYFAEIQNYMPGKHRDFIAYVQQNIFIRDYIDGVGIAELEQIYTEVVRMIVVFRTKHRTLVKEYILNMINSNTKQDDARSNGKDEDEDAEDSEDVGDAEDAGNTKEESDGEEQKGTGGTSLKSFLEESITETRAAKFPEKKTNVDNTKNECFVS